MDLRGLFEIGVSWRFQTREISWLPRNIEETAY